MCRLALMNKTFIVEAGIPALEELFTALEKAMGGHGMGVALVGKEVVALKKSTKLSPLEAATFLYTTAKTRKNPYRFAIFHTRMATNGSVNDSNCHPFVDEDNQVVLAHNGHIHDLSDSNNDYTDSEIAHQLIAIYGLPLHSLMRWSGVFVGGYYGVPYVAKNAAYNDLELMLNHETGAYCFASTLRLIHAPHFHALLKNYETVEARAGVWSGKDIDAYFYECRSKRDTGYNYKQGKYGNVPQYNRAYHDWETGIHDDDEWDKETGIHDDDEWDKETRPHTTAVDIPTTSKHYVTHEGLSVKWELKPGEKHVFERFVQRSGIWIPETIEETEAIKKLEQTGGK